jgi:hypothetical protein
MPILEFVCGKGHKTEKLYLTFGEADNVESIACPECMKTYTKVNQNRPKARRIISLPGQAILYGEGFYKPAASGKLATRGMDPSKAAKEVAQEMGAANIANAVKGSK